MNVHVNLYLDKVNSKDQTYLLFSIAFNNKRFRINSGFKIQPSAWNVEKQSIRKNTDPNYEEKNHTLKKRKSEIEKVFLQARLSGIIPDREYFINNLSFTRKPVSSKNFIPLFEEYIESMSAKNSPHTITICNGVKKHLTDFAKEENFELSFDRIDLVFYEKFTNYLLITKKLQDNTIRKDIKKLKTYLKWATTHGYNTKLEYTKFRPVERRVDIFPMTLEECTMLENADLSSELSQIRDIFLIECYTGLRFSDIQNLKSENIKDGVINVTTIKTRQFLKIPIIPKAKIILEKYLANDDQGMSNGIPQISNFLMNRFLKDACKEAGINSPCLKISYMGPNRIENKYLKYQLITTHSGRQAFITNSLLLGIPSEIVMKVVGHSSYSTFKRYIKFTDQQLKNEMKAWETV